MENNHRIAFLGGDERQKYAAEYLAARGGEVVAWGNAAGGEGVTSAPDWQSAVRGADAVVLPLPVSGDGIRLRCPGVREEDAPRLSALLGELGQVRLFGGKIPDAFRESAAARGIVCSEFLDSESLCLRNASATAEAAIGLAMNELPVMIDRCAAAVIGYGRIGSFLAAKLTALGATVTVFARRREVLTLAKLHGCRAVCLEPGAFSALPGDCRVIFNTVPAWVLTGEDLLRVPRKCLLMDLASAPGGIDRAGAERLGLRCLWGTALPGKCVPESAGIFLGETVAEALGMPE